MTTPHETIRQALKRKQPKCGCKTMIVDTENGGTYIENGT
jgi:hypothetical protein